MYGDVRLLKSGKSEVNYLVSYNNPSIISKEIFEAEKMEKERRSNLEKKERTIEKTGSIVQRGSKYKCLNLQG